MFNETRAKQVIEEQMLPLVGEQQRIFENNLETMEVRGEDGTGHLDSSLSLWSSSSSSLSSSPSSVSSFLSCLFVLLKFSPFPLIFETHCLRFQKRKKKSDSLPDLII